MTGIFESTLCPLVNPLLGLLVTSFFSVCCSGLLVRYPIIRPRTFAAVMSIIILIFGLLAVGSLDKNLAGFQFYFAINLSVLAPSMSFGLDGFSGIFVLLTVFIVPLCLLSVWRLEYRTSALFALLLCMEFLLLFTFTVLDIFYFYVAFESLLIPMFVIIGYWGSRSRRVKAAYYFFLFTLAGSILFLFGIIYLYTLCGTTDYCALVSTKVTPDQQLILWPCFFVAFAVKMPLFPVHIWLPEAHVEAPTVGSILLASLLLKLGGYGFMRFSLVLTPDASNYYGPIVVLITSLGVLYASLSTIRQTDFKRVIAYSSVAHMNLTAMGIFSGQNAGLVGAVYIMIAHGVVSSALFFCVGVLYDRHGSRALQYYTGLSLTMPLFSFLFLLVTLANMGFPGTANFIGELLIFLGLGRFNLVSLLFGGMGIVLSAIYSIWLYNRIVFGTINENCLPRTADLTAHEFLFLLICVSAMLFLGINSSFCVQYIEASLRLMLIA